MTINSVRAQRLLASRLQILAAAVLAALVMGNPASADKITKVAILGGTQEVPPVATPGSGCAVITIDTVSDTLEYYIVFSDMAGAETAAHIHGPADPGVNAGVLHPLPLGNPKVGSWSYDPSVEGDILAGKTYINIHSAAFPGGEIRGQIVDMVALLNGAQESPPVATPAAGFGLFNVDHCANTISYYINYGGFGTAETGAHIHGFALHATNAGVKHGLPAGTTKVGTWVYDEADEFRILNGQTYVNIHSVANPGGEIRGQITRFVVPLDATQEVPPNASIGHGCGMIAMAPGATTLSYYLEYSALTGVASAQHIHGFAAPGVNAGVKHTLAVANPVIGGWTYPAADEAGILAGMTYFNVHTAANPGGEIRGQIVPPLEPCFTDVDCDGATGITDLLALLANWGPCPAPPAPCPWDIDRDGNVGIVDLLALLAGWGPCP